MQGIAGVFNSTETAARVAEQLSPLLGEDRIILLTDEDQDEVSQRVPVTEDMPPVGGPILGVIAGSVIFGIAIVHGYVAGGSFIGFLMALVLGVFGGAFGWRIGQLLDRRLYRGLPTDELFIYQDALRQDRSVVIALVRSPNQDAYVRRVFKESGAESVDHARQQWWLGLRDAEESAYETGTVQFRQDESVFRKGFEAALSRQAERRDPEQVKSFLKRFYPADYKKTAFQRGFERGRAYRKRRAAAAALETSEYPSVVR